MMRPRAAETYKGTGGPGTQAKRAPFNQERYGGGHAPLNNTASKPPSNLSRPHLPVPLAPLHAGLEPQARNLGLAQLLGDGDAAQLDLGPQREG